MSKKIKQAKRIRFTPGTRIDVGNGYFIKPLKNGDVRVEEAGRYFVSKLPKQLITAMAQLPAATRAYNKANKKYTELKSITDAFTTHTIRCGHKGRMSVGCTIVPPNVIAAARKALKV